MHFSIELKNQDKTQYEIKIDISIHTPIIPTYKTNRIFFNPKYPVLVNNQQLILVSLCKMHNNLT